MFLSIEINYPYFYLFCFILVWFGLDFVSFCLEGQRYKKNDQFSEGAIVISLTISE